MTTLSAAYLPKLSVKLDKGVLQVAAAIIIAKAAFFLLIFMAYHTLPFADGTRNANFTYQHETHSFITTFKTWDGQHYHAISESGYLANQMSSAFYPLYPATIQLFRAITGSDSVTAGLLVSNIASFFAYILLYLFFRRETNEKTALWGTLIMLSFPVAFYTNIVYSEAVFLLLAATLFWGTIHRYWGVVFIAAFLLSLSRPQGLLIALPYGIYIWHANQWRIKPTLFNPAALTSVFFALGFCLYLSIIHWETGYFLSGFDSQKHFISGNSLSNILELSKWLDKNFVSIDLAVHGFTNSMTDRAFFIFYLASLVLITIKLQNKGFLACAIVLGLLPALAGSFMSYARYTLIIFPIFYAFGATLKTRSNYLIALCIPLQALFAIRHCLNYWQG